MWWSCFTWYEKGPYYIWEDKTLEERREAKEDLAARNRAKYQADYTKWVADMPFRRLRISDTQIPSVKPTFRHNKLHGAFVRGDSNGIDWYRYQIKIIKGKLLPFYYKLMRKYS